jgi:hypothetical protein
MVKGDGVKYCDMTGSGSDDYIVCRCRWFPKHKKVKCADTYVQSSGSPQQEK